MSLCVSSIAVFQCPLSVFHGVEGPQGDNSLEDPVMVKEEPKEKPYVSSNDLHFRYTRNEKQGHFHFGDNANGKHGDVHFG